MKILTTDLYEGAWFLSQGMELSDLWMGGNGKRAIVFEFVGDHVEGLKEEYKRGKAQANVLKLKESLNELKDRMFLLLRDRQTTETRLRKGGEDEICGRGVVAVKGE